MRTPILLRLSLVLGLGALGCTATATAADFGPTAAPAAIRSFMVGKIHVTALHDAQYVAPNDGTVFGTDVGTAAVGDFLRSRGMPTDRVTLSLNSLLVKTGHDVLLLDAGLGSQAPDRLLEDLKMAGVSPQSITQVLITHSHGDHVGGLVDAAGKLTFPRASIRMAAAEWTWLQGRGPAELVAAIKSQVRTFEPGATLAAGVKSVNIAGHTPGHMGYEITSGAARLLDIGDMAHSSLVSLSHPEWTLGFDSDASAARATRENTLGELARSGELIFAPHFPFPGVGHVVVEERAFAWAPGVP